MLNVGVRPPQAYTRLAIVHSKPPRKQLLNKQIVPHLFLRDGLCRKHQMP